MIKKREFSQGGICYLICECNLPDLPPGSAGRRMERLLAQMAETVFTGAEEAFSALAEKYEANPDPKKHLRHRPLFFTLQATCEEKKRFYLISFRLRICRCGRTLLQKKGAARFDKKSGRLLGGAKFDL